MAHPLQSLQRVWFFPYGVRRLDAAFSLIADHHFRPCVARHGGQTVVEFFVVSFAWAF